MSGIASYSYVDVLPTVSSQGLFERLFPAINLEEGNRFGVCRIIITSENHTVHSVSKVYDSSIQELAEKRQGGKFQGYTEDSPEFGAKFSSKEFLDGESDTEVYWRVLPWIVQCANKHLGHTIAVQTHKCVMSALLIGQAATYKKVHLEHERFDHEKDSVMLFESDGQNISLKGIKGFVYKPL